MKKQLFVLIAVLSLLGFLVAAQSGDRPTYTVSYASGPIMVDGSINESAWKSAQLIEYFVDNATGERRAPETTARVLYDDRFIYFAFDCADENLWSTFRNRDEHLWTEEVVEVFLQADPNHPNYIELEVNPLNTMLDIYLLDIRKPLKYESWNSADLKWAVNLDGTVDGNPGDKGWSCEIALPLDDVVTAPNIPPKSGDTWRMNLYRVEKKPERQSLAWAPTLKRDFHVPARFGDIVFEKNQE